MYEEEKEERGNSSVHMHMKKNHGCENVINKYMYMYVLSVAHELAEGSWAPGATCTCTLVLVLLQCMWLYNKNTTISLLSQTWCNFV